MSKEELLIREKSRYVFENCNLPKGNLFDVIKQDIADGKITVKELLGTAVDFLFKGYYPPAVENGIQNLIQEGIITELDYANYIFCLIDGKNYFKNGYFDSEYDRSCSATQNGSHPYQDEKQSVSQKSVNFAERESDIIDE